jgi:hypothetical protein
LTPCCFADAGLAELKKTKGGREKTATKVA